MRLFVLILFFSISVSAQNEILRRESVPKDLPDPVVKFDVNAYPGARSNVMLAQKMAQEYARLYADALQNEYVKLRGIPPELSPLRRADLILIAFFSKRNSLPRLELEKIRSELKRVLYRHIARFENSPAFIIAKKLIETKDETSKKMDDFETRLQILEGNKPSNDAKSQMRHVNDQILDLQEQLKESTAALERVKIFSYAGLGIGVLVMFLFAYATLKDF